MLNVGEKDELKVNGTEDAAAWSSSAPTVASVNSAGEVTALTKGNAVITAEVNGESVTCTVTVKMKATRRTTAAPRQSPTMVVLPPSPVIPAAIPRWM